MPKGKKCRISISGKYSLEFEFILLKDCLIVTSILIQKRKENYYLARKKKHVVYMRVHILALIKFNDSQKF